MQYSVLLKDAAGNLRDWSTQVDTETPLEAARKGLQECFDAVQKNPREWRPDTQAGWNEARVTLIGKGPAHYWRFFVIWKKRVPQIHDPHAIDEARRDAQYSPRGR